MEGQLAHTTVSAILEWNRRLRVNRAEVVYSFILYPIILNTPHPQNKLRRHVCALLYPVSGGRPRSVLLPVVSQIDDAVAAVWPEDLDLREWFPFGAERDRLSYFPLNPHHKLQNHYSIFTGTRPDRLAPNDCLNSRWGLDVSGNVVVIRHARTNLMRVTNIHAVEHQLLNFIVSR